MPDIETILKAKQEHIDAMHALQPGRTALVVVDMQHGFLDEGDSLEVPPGREIIPNIAALIEACRAKQMPVVFTEFVYSTAVPCLRGDPFGPEHLPTENNGEGEAGGFGFPSNNCLVHPMESEGVESAATVDELKPLPGELVVRGHTYDKFVGTPLDLALRSMDIRCLMFTGVLTDVCVCSTLMTAAMLDYRCTAVTDGVATLWPELQDACFTIWQRKYARLRTTTELIAEVNAL